MNCPTCNKPIVSGKTICLECFIRSGLPIKDPTKSHWEGDTHVFILPDHVSRPPKDHEYYGAHQSSQSWVRKFTLDGQKYKVYDLELDQYTNDALDLLALEDADGSFFGELWVPMGITLLITAFCFLMPFTGVWSMLTGNYSFSNVIEDMFITRFTLFVFILATGLYFLPSIVAYLRGKMVLSLVNLLVGFTMIGWIVQLVFAFRGENKRKA